MEAIKSGEFPQVQQKDFDDDIPIEVIQASIADAVPIKQSA